MNIKKLLQESNQILKGYNINTYSDRDFEEILREDQMFDMYVDSLSKNFSTNDKAVFKQLSQNLRARLTEAAQIEPYAPTQFPILEVVYWNTALKDAMRPQVTDKDFFTRTFYKSFIYRFINDQKQVAYLPEGVYKLAENVNGQKVEVSLNALTGTKAFAVTEWKIYKKTGAGDVDPKITVRDQFTNELAIVGVEIASGKKTTHRLEIKSANMDNTVYALAINNATEVPEAILGVNFNLKEKTAVAFVNKEDHFELANAKAVATLSNIWNEGGQWSFSKETKQIAISIPDGLHLNVEIPVQVLSKYRSMFSVDYVAGVTEEVYTAIELVKDQEFVNYFTEKLDQANPAFKGEVSIVPHASYKDDLVAWRSNMVKDQVEKIATKIKSTTYLGNGTFVIMGTPDVIRNLHGVNWTWGASSATDGEERVASYSIGTFRSTSGYVFKVLSSPIAKFDTKYAAGKPTLAIVFLPSNPEQCTFDYYPYYMGLEKANYRSSNHTNVPAMVFMRRHTMFTFMNVIGEIKLVETDPTKVSETVKPIIAF